jgi:cytochrome P450
VTAADVRSADTLAVVDPATYESGPPLEALRRLRAEGPVVWVDEPALHGFPAGPGFWLVLRHAEVERVLRDPSTFSSWLGATQVRDASDLDWVRRMMLNMDPPDHSRLRRLLSRSFTPRAVAALTASIEATAARLVDRMIGRDAEGRCDFAKDVAADLPLITLADVLGVQPGDRLAGPGLRILRSLRREQRHRTGSAGGLAASGPGRGRADARPAHTRGHAGPLRVRAAAG